MRHLESSLDVMGHADLLQWLHLSRQTGCCTFVERHKNRRVYVQDGVIVAAESNEPHLLLGQFLIATGRIRPDVLQKAMMVQERSGTRLGDVLVEQGIIGVDERDRIVRAKVEETVYGLFDWHEGVFRFVPGIEPPPAAMRVDLSITHVLFEGARRADEMARAIEVLGSKDVVLRRTARPIDGPTVAGYSPRRLYEAVDGRRSIEEIVLHCRTSPYLAYSFLARLVERGLVEICASAAPSPEVDERDRVDLAVSDLQQLVGHEQYEAAVDLIEARHVVRGDDGFLAMLIAKAEAGYLALAYRSMVPPSAVPCRADPGGRDADVEGDLGAEETFLLELIDGRWDVRSLVWIAPLRGIEVVRALVRLRDLGYIELHEREDATRDEAGDPSGPRRSIDDALDDAFTPPA